MIRVTRVCSICGEKFDAVPAVSRKDGALICPDCGTREALAETFGCDTEEQDHILDLIHKEAENAGEETETE